MRLLDRYVLRYFLQAYFYCIAGFVSIWFIFDISDNLSTFLDERVSRSLIAQYYLTQVPQILVILLPVALLLATLFCLGRMSRSNEIVSMLTAGISIPRVIAPLLLVGLFTTAVSTLLNYSLAPHADYTHKTILEDPKSSRRLQVGVVAQIFRNRTDNRTWFIQKFKPGENLFTTVHIVQQDADDNIVTNYIAKSATYHPEAKTWELEQGKVIHYDGAGNIMKMTVFPSLTIDHWSETPFRLGSANFRAEYLSVPELRDYLSSNSDFPETLLAPFATHWYYRLSLPWTCLVIAFIAAPLGIGFSRRGVLSSVGSAIILVFSMNFVTHLFLALGEGARIPSWAAAWTPNLLFGTIGLVLLYYRASNKEFPRLNLFGEGRLIAP